MKKLMNRKNIFFLVLGIIVSSIPAYYAAEILFAADELSYNNNSSKLNSTNVQDALVELYNLANTEYNPIPNTGFKLGDYFTMVPDSTEYTITAGTTGYTSDQTINPSELTLWRVIDIQSNGSIEAVSEYVSSAPVYFSGVTGYANFVGGLQTIAGQYAKVGYTVNTRMMGYGGQTPTIEDISAFNGSTDTAPSTTSTQTPYTDVGQEYNGGVLGDTLYLKDIQLVGNVYKTDTTKYGDYGLKAYLVNATTTNGNYWLASRCFGYSSATVFYFSARRVNSGSLGNRSLRGFSSGWGDGPYGYSVRPIITLKSGIQINGGTGAITDPYTITA